MFKTQQLAQFSVNSGRFTPYLFSESRRLGVPSQERQCPESGFSGIKSIFGPHLEASQISFHKSDCRGLALGLSQS